MANDGIPRGERVRSLRVARGMTQEKLARMSNVDIKTIYRAERGQAAMRPETLLDIASALEVPVAEISRRSAAPAGEANWSSEGHGNLVLRRVERASSFYQLAESCDHYSWSFRVDPDEATADAIREVMQIVRRATGGPSDHDEQGEFSEPARVARLKALVEQLAGADVSLLANRFIHVDGPRTAVVLRVLFEEGRVDRRKEFADFSLPEEAGQGGAPMKSKVIEGVGALDFDERGSSLMGALELALATIGDPIPYEELMGSSGAAFRVQMALPEWCPSAAYAAVGYDCVPNAAAAIGRSIDWIPAEPAATRPMERRIQAIVESIDRDVPVLYGAEECGLIVGYHDSGEQFSLRTYFDPTEMYVVLSRLDWPSPGILGERKDRPSRDESLRRSLEVAVALARCEERFPTHHPGRSYACGFAAWEAWIDGLRDRARFDCLGGPELVVAIQANSWCYTSLIDARRAAAKYLRSFELDLADTYDEMVSTLRGCLPEIPHPQVQPKDDGTAVGYRMTGADTWSPGARERQAETLEVALDLERRATLAIEALLARG